MKTTKEIVKYLFDMEINNIVHEAIENDKIKKSISEDIKVGTIVLHFKHEYDEDNLINYLYIVTDMVTHTETEETLVIYTALYGDHKSYARPLEMFCSDVDKEKYPDIKQRQRLRPILNFYPDYVKDELSLKLIFDLARKKGLDTDGDILVHDGTKYLINERDHIVIKLNQNPAKIPEKYEDNGILNSEYGGKINELSNHILQSYRIYEALPDIIKSSDTDIRLHLANSVNSINQLRWSLGIGINRKTAKEGES